MATNHQCEDQVVSCIRTATHRVFIDTGGEGAQRTKLSVCEFHANITKIEMSILEWPCTIYPLPTIQLQGV